jgi:hypothetical protein
MYVAIKQVRTHINNGEIFIMTFGKYAFVRDCITGPLQWNNTSGKCDLNGLKCKYHGWAYNLEGKLVGVPAFCDATDGKLDKSEFNLWPMRVALWRGLIFIQTLPNTESDPCAGTALSGPDADAAFVRENQAFCDRLSGRKEPGGVVSAASSVPLEEFELHSSATHKINCNWKVYIDKIGCTIRLFLVPVG